jgi:hypothetical protein
MSGNQLISILEALFLFYVAWTTHRYYHGKMSLDKTAEERRVRVVSKYGPIFFAVIFISTVCGLGLLYHGVFGG